MKVIDLLNKIANTKDYKDIPKKVKITTGSLKEEYRIWIWDGAWYVYEEDGMDVCICTDKLDLNDKVEIIKEDDKISKDIKWYLIDFQEEEKTKIAQVNMNFKIIREKMGEIIDKINEEK